MKVKRKIIKNSIGYTILWFTVFCFFESCNIAKHVPEDEFLIKKIDVSFINDSVQGYNNIYEQDLIDLIKQSPNRKIFSKFRFHLRLYNLSNQERIDKFILNRQGKIEKINKKIAIQNDKKTREDSTKKIKPLKVRSLTIGEKIQKVGEAPVILNGLMTNSTLVQFQKYLFNKGYYQSQINNSIIYLKKRQVHVSYSINKGPATKIQNINYDCEDQGIVKYLDSIKQFSLLKQGDQFDTEILTKERSNITYYLQNRGFYSFNKEFIFFDLDTLNILNGVNLTLGIQNYRKFNNEKNQITELPHQQFNLNKFYVRITPNLNYNFNSKTNDSITQFLHIDNYQSIKFKNRIIKNAISFKKNQLYRKIDAEQTYKRLIGLGLFKSVSLKFDTIGNRNLNGVVNLIPTKTQSFSVSIDGTNSEGIYGTEGSLNYAHKNIFHGGEKLLLSMRGGLETQLLYSGDSLNTNNTFNTLELGPEFHFIIPKYFLINRFKGLKSHTNAKTEITGSINYQRRPDFTRWNQELSFGWIFHEKKPITWHINPLLLSSVDIDLDSLYEIQINSLNDQFIATSFLDHVVAGGLFSFEYNGQKLKFQRNEFYAKATFESAGGFLFRFHELIEKPKDTITNSYYELFNIRYSHFQKFSVDLRYYQPIFLKSKLVYRFFGGLGIPRDNQLQALPFEKSFFSGGSNGMRAWKVRSLGPGSFFDGNSLDSIQRFDKIGDIKLEGNLEARFPLSDWIEGAIFLDMGNVWLLREDSLRSTGQFKWNSFADQIAFGGGLGIRLNLDFFIIRLDIAIPLKNPAIPINELRYPNSTDITRYPNSYWIFNGKYSDRKDFHPVQFNVGIGYPF